MKCIVLLGAPGSGKGTQAENITKWYDIPQIAPGDIFRANVKAGSGLGKMVQVYIDAGRLVPDEVTIKLTRERLAEADCANGFILDGYPRSVAQAEALDGFLAEMGQKLNVAASIFVDDETIIKRLSGRRTCGGCGKPYHVEYNPPAVTDVCDACGAGLTRRADDCEETVRDRLSVYYERTAPLIERYRRQGVFVQITGHEAIGDTTGEMAAALRKVFGE